MLMNRPPLCLGALAASWLGPAQLQNLPRSLANMPASRTGRRICRHKRLELETAAEAVTAIARSAPAAPGDNCGRVTVLLPAVPKAQPVFGELLHALFGLTPAERGLATALSAGDHLCDIATNRGVALNTVRAQLKSVFGKVGVTSQSDLVRTLLTLQMAAGCAQPLNRLRGACHPYAS